MENTSKPDAIRRRDIFYYRQRLKNRVFAKLASFFADEAERRGITKKDIATRLGRNPSQITRWLASPSNLTLETLSDLLLALDAELEPPQIILFSDRSKPNYAHPLITRLTGASAQNAAFLKHADLKKSSEYVNLINGEQTHRSTTA